MSSDETDASESKISEYLDVLNRDSYEVGFLGVSEAELPGPVDDIIHGDSVFDGPYTVRRGMVTVKEWIKIALESPSIGGGSPGDGDGIGFSSLSNGIKTLVSMVSGGGFRKPGEPPSNTPKPTDGSGSGGSGLTGFLTTNFLDANNRPQWGRLATTTLGGIAIAFYEGTTGYILAIGEGIGSLYGQIANGISAGAGSAINTVTTTLSGVVDPVSAGILGLPVNVIVLLVSLFLIARATEVI